VTSFKPPRGTRKKKRSTKNRRITAGERAALFKECKHKTFRYRNSGTEAVCLCCGAVQKLRGNNVANIDVTTNWQLPYGEDTID
jgi:hypothetical protein